jgi:hypothetical protein
MKRMTKLVSSFAAGWLILGGLVVTDLAPDIQAADTAQVRAYLISIPDAT